MSSVFQFRLVTLIALTQNCGSNHHVSDFSFFQQTHNVQISPYILLVIFLVIIFNFMFYLQILTTHQAIQMLLYRNQKTFSLLH